MSSRRSPSCPTTTESRRDRNGPDGPDHSTILMGSTSETQAAALQVPEMIHLNCVARNVQFTGCMNEDRDPASRSPRTIAGA